MKLPLQRHLHLLKMTTFISRSRLRVVQTHSRPLTDLTARRFLFQTSSTTTFVPVQKLLEAAAFCAHGDASSIVTIVWNVGSFLPSSLSRLDVRSWFTSVKVCLVPSTIFQYFAPRTETLPILVPPSCTGDPSECSTLEFHSVAQSAMKCASSQ